MGKIIDITGQQFGFLTAIEPTRVNGRFGWKCECVCGKNIAVESNNLRTGKTKSCGCQTQSLISSAIKKDLTGRQYGFLTVLGPTEQRSSSGSIVWKCQCECGNIVYIPTSNLDRNHTRSCGCKKYELAGQSNSLDLIGRKFYKLTVIKQLTTNNSHESCWLCQCDCGNICEVIGWHLTTERVQSCGCLSASKGEAKIAQILIDNNIAFETEKTFQGCISPNGHPFRFDFFVNGKYLIEYDGEQHFLQKPNALYSLEDIQRIKQYDEMKNNWCKEHNIPLIRIKYTQYSQLTLDDLLLKEE